MAPARAVPSPSQPRGGPSDAAAPPSSSSANGLPTLDVPLAVSQLGGDEELFRTLLTQFVEATECLRRHTYGASGLDASTSPRALGDAARR